MLLSRERFLLIYHSFRFTDEQLLLIEPGMQELIESLWIPATCVVVDETMVATKSRRNPHHVFIMRKPHPHGIKVWSMVDMSGYVLAYSVYRRNQPKESPSDTLNRMTRALSEKSLIIADSYFGGIDALTSLSARGMDCVLSCNQR